VLIPAAYGLAGSTWPPIPARGTVTYWNAFVAATIGWSYDLLSTNEQRLFARMVVFRGGCTLEAAEQVADADVAILQSLHDKSLLRRTGERFWMLETIREYARELLEQGGEGDAVRRRHADHFLALGELAYTERFDRGLTWAGRLEAEHDNLRAALDYLQVRDPLRYLRLASPLGWFWMARSHYAEGARRLEDALASTGEGEPLTARALTYLGAIEAARGLFAAALRRLEQAIALWRTVEDETELAAARDELGWALYEGGEDGPTFTLKSNLPTLRPRSAHAFAADEERLGEVPG
jgi:hypothetical protein